MRPGLWIDSFPLLFGIAIATTATVVIASWDILRDVIADIRAARARNKLRLVSSSRHR